MNRLKHAWITVLAMALAAGAMANDTNVEAQPKQEHGISVVIDTDKPSLSQDVMEKLSPEQILELEKYKASQRDEIPNQAPLIVGIVFACPVAIIGVILFYRHRRNLALHKTLAAMIDKGVPIPPELLQPEKPRRSDLRRGFVLIATGLGLTIFFLAEHDRAWGLGFIPLLIGVGYLLAWKLAKKNGNG